LIVAASTTVSIVNGLNAGPCADPPGVKKVDIGPVSQNQQLPPAIRQTAHELERTESRQVVSCSRPIKMGGEGDVQHKGIRVLSSRQRYFFNCLTQLGSEIFFFFFFQSDNITLQKKNKSD